MKKKLLFASLLVPVAAAGYLSFHPGVALAAPTYAQSNGKLAPGSYTVDPLHTSIGFEINHLGLATVHGRFTKKMGKLTLGKTIEQSQVEFTVEASSIDTAVPPRDDHLRSKDFFEVEKYPTISFKSTRIRKSLGSSNYIADGKMTIKQTTKNVSIRFKYFGPITDPWGGTRVGAIIEPFTVNRQDYGVAFDARLPNGTPQVANQVKMVISVEATLDKPTK